MIRAYAEKEIRPKVPALEAGEISPFDLSRKMMNSFGGNALLAKPLEKLAQAREKGEQGGGDLTRLMSAEGKDGQATDDPMMMNIFVSWVGMAYVRFLCMKGLFCHFPMLDCLVDSLLHISFL